MANLVIKDLPDNIVLDREAMQAISGGARNRRPGLPAQTVLRSTRLFDYPPGVTRTAPATKTTAAK